MKYKKGFTIIEITVTVAIIAILATFVGMALTGQQVKARDAARSSKVTIIADALERYYDKHGEYPSVRALLNTYSDNTGSAVASLLSINEKTTLVMPGATASTTNSIAASVTSNDTIAYVASSAVGNDNCQSSAQGGCDQYTLSYKKESDGSTVNVESQKRIAIADNVNPLQAPTKPTITASQSGTSLTATSSAPACSTSQSMTPRYAFKTQTGTGSWSAWSAWQTSSSYTLASNVDTTSYSFQVHVRCESSAAMSDTSSDSDTTSITYYTPPTTPSAPTIGSYVLFGSVIAQVNAVTCDVGTDQYRIDSRTNDGTWVTGAWGSTITASQTANDGVKYGYRAAGRCVNGTQIATSATSAETTYIDPITAPGAPTMSGTGPTWSWSAAACPAGTSASYQYRFTYNSTSNFTGSWTLGSWITTSSTSATNSAATSQGVKYGIDIQQMCSNANAASAWGAQNGGATFIMPVTHAYVSHWSSMIISGGYPKVLIKTYQGGNPSNTGVCASGLTRQTNLSVKWYTTTWEGPTAWFTGTEGYTQTFTSHTLLTDTDTAEFGTKTRCVNNSTGYAIDQGRNPSLDSPFDIGNLINSSGKYIISCKTASGYQSYCAGGYDTGGTKNSTSTSILNCAERSTGIDTLNIRNTARFTFGSASPCWSA